MRIISQNGNYSVNFDNILLERRGDTIIGLMSQDGKAYIILGKYSDDEEAGEVFAEIHNLYDEQFERPFNPEEWIEVYKMPQAGEYGI